MSKRDSLDELSEKFNAHMDRAFYVGICKEAPSLSIKDLEKAKTTLDRYTKIYFVAQKHLPDDCYGIMYVRPEDMPK